MGSTGSPGSQSALRALNQSRIVATLRVAGELSQADLARHTGLAPATISNIVHSLETAGTVAIRHDGGRRRSVRLARRAGYVAGVDYGHRHVTVAIADLSHEVLAEQRVELDAGVPAEVGLGHAADLLHAVLEQAELDSGQIVATGIGVPAPIDRKTARVGSPTILPGWVGVCVRDVAAELFGLRGPIVVDNDANLGALAEHRWGAGVGVADMAYLKLSEGVGAGLVLDGRLYGGPGGTAGEIGHTTVDEYGEVCRCGNRGCLETLVSARHVTSLLEPTHGPGLTIAEVVALAHAGDRGCARVLTDTGSQVGRAIADLCSLLNPDLVVVGGELAQADSLLLRAIQDAVGRCGVPAAGERVRLTTAALGPRTHVLGAIALALSDTSSPVFNQ